MIICSPGSSITPSLLLSIPSFASAKGPWKKSIPTEGGFNP